VARRTREFGGCLALGARPADILSGVVRQCLVLAAAGITFGLYAVLALTRAMTGILYGVSPRDPWTLAGSGAELLQNLLCRRW
jgi:ABC-type antimicrobial peptide transport system permease subunit